MQAGQGSMQARLVSGPLLGASWLSAPQATLWQKSYELRRSCPARMGAGLLAVTAASGTCWQQHMLLPTQGVPFFKHALLHMQVSGHMTEIVDLTSAAIATVSRYILKAIQLAVPATMQARSAAMPLACTAGRLSVLVAKPD